jgi:tape measure domain-containing protein
MATVVDVLANIRANSSQFVSEMERAKKSTDGLGTSANTTADLVGRKLKYGILAANAALGAFIVTGLKTASTFQQSEIAFTQFLGSGEKATTFLKELQQFSAKTPFEFTEVVDASKQLLAYGFTADKVLPMLTAVGDAASAVGRDKMPNIIRALGQIQAKGKVSAEEMRQLAETGIPVWGYLSAAIGKTTQETMKMAEDGLIPADWAINQLLYSIENGAKGLPAFGGLMEAQSKTIAGSMSNMKDAASIAFIEGFKPFTEDTAKGISGMVPLVKAGVGTLVTILTTVIKSVVDFGRGLATILAPAFTTIVMPAIKLFIGAILGVLTVLGAVGRFVTANSNAFTIFGGVLAVVAAAYIGLRAGALAHLAITKAQVAWSKVHTAWMSRQAIMTGVLTKAQRLLNLTMAFNPIGLIIGAIAALVAAFVILWNKSDTFRKIMIAIGKAGIIAIGYLIEWLGKLAMGIIKLQSGPLRLLLKGLALLKVPGAQAALDGINNAIDAGSDFFEKAGKKVRGYADNLDKLAKSGKAAKKEVVPEYKMPEFADPGAFDPGGANGKADGIKKAQEKLLKDLNEQADKLTEEAKTRAGAMQKFNDLLREPFGTPSEISKAMSGATASVDSIIGMYDKLVEAVNERFTGLDPANRDKLTKFLETQTTDLVKAAKKREGAVKKLEDAQEELKDLVADQAKFADQIQGSMKSFGTALIDLSNTDSKAVLSVTKTATGTVISQIKKSSSGVDAVTKQLTDRLGQITEFGGNIEKLLASGLNKDYLRQLLEAGPEAAAGTAKVLAAASADQLAQINSLYTKINETSTSFGTKMAGVFYGNSVAMAQGLVDGAKSKVAEIDTQMAAIVASINGAVAGLGTSGMTAGTAFGKGIYDGLKAEEAKITALAAKIAADISAALAAKDALESDAGGGAETAKDTTKKQTTKKQTVSTTPYGGVDAARTAYFASQVPKPPKVVPMPTTLSQSVGSTATVAMPKTLLRSQGGGATINITTNKVVPTVTPSTINKAVSSATKAKK